MSIPISTTVMEQLKAHGIIPVMRLASDELAWQAISGLEQAGFSTFEITLSIPGAVQLIAELSKNFRRLVGAGTVLSLEQAQACLEAGARYIVSPAIVAGLPQLCQEAGASCIMGGLTPSEVLTVAKEGASAIKVFPASSLGGASYLRALKSVFPELELVPTGGVNINNVADYFKAGAACVGVGGDLIDMQALLAGDLLAVTRHAQNYLDAFKQLS